MLALLIAISILTFLIFDRDAEPGASAGGTAPRRCADRAVEREWGFNKPIYVRYLDHGEDLHRQGDLLPQQVNVGHHISDLPPTISLAIGAGIIWFFVGILFGVLARCGPDGGSTAL